MADFSGEGSFIISLDYLQMFSADVEAEMDLLIPWLSGRRVLCNCGDDLDSAFFGCLSSNFKRYGLASLVCISHGEEVARQIVMDSVGKVFVNLLKGDGSFESPEGLYALDAADLVVAFPPPSLFEAYLTLLLEEAKDFVVLGPLSAALSTPVVKAISAGRVWIGRTRPSRFMDENRVIRAVGNLRWFTNMAPVLRPDPLALRGKVSDGFYATYTDIDGIDVFGVDAIPSDWPGVMGVSKTFLDVWSPEQFRVVGSDRWYPGIADDGALGLRVARDDEDEVVRVRDRLLIQRIS